MLAYMSLCRLMPSRWVALGTTLLAFSSYYWLYYNDMVSTELTSVFGVMLAFHGMALFAQEGRFRQLLVKACIALLLGWHVYGLLLPFILFGLPGEMMGGLRERRSLPLMGQVRGALIAPIRSRYLALGVATLLFGIGLLGFNLANEYYALKGEIPLAELPTAQSALDRVGRDEGFSRAHAEVVDWRELCEGAVLSHRRDDCPIWGSGLWGDRVGLD